jgi:hypothetical protein
LVVPAVFAALDLAYNVSFNPDLVMPVSDALAIPPACILDADSPTYNAAITFLLTARPIMAIIGPANDSSAMAMSALQQRFHISVPLITYSGGLALRDRSLYPYYLSAAFSMESGVRFVLSAMKFYGQNRIAVVYCDDRSFPAALSDSLPSYEAYVSFVEQSVQFSIYPHSISSVPWNPTIADFSKIIQQWQAQNVSTALLLLPRISNYQAFALACHNLGFYGVNKLIFPLTYNSYFTNFVAGTVMATVSSFWFIAAYRKQYTNLAPYNAMVALVNSPKYNITQAKTPVHVMFAFDALLVLNQVMYQSQKNESQNLLNAIELIESIRSTDFTQNQDGHLLTLLASGAISWVSDSNLRIGATGTGDYMQMLVPWPVRTRFGTSVDNYNFLPQLDPPNFPNFIPATSCCTAGGGYTQFNTSLKQSKGITLVRCLPCPSGTWSSYAKSVCIPCSSNQWCPLNTPLNYGLDSPFFQQAKSLVPLQTGQPLLPPALIAAVVSQYTYLGLGLGLFCLSGALVVLFLYRCRMKLHMQLREIFQSFDILFKLDHKQPVLGEPLIPQKTAVGGFVFCVFIVFSIFFTVYFVDTAFTDQYSIGAGSSAGFSDLLGSTSAFNNSSVTPLEINITYVGLDNSAACAQICQPLLPLDSGQSPNFWCDFDPNPICTATLLDSSTCLVKYFSTISSILLPSSFSCSSTVVNSRVMAIYYQIGALRFLSNMYGLSGSVFAPANSTLRGPAATEIDIVLVPYVFNGTLLKFNNAPAFFDAFAPRTITVGHLTQFVGSTRGSIRHAADLVDISGNAQASEVSAFIVFRFERAASSVVVTLSSSFDILNEISIIAGFVASVLLVGLRIFVKVVEKVARNYSLFVPPMELIMVRKRPRDHIARRTLK